MNEKIREYQVIGKEIMCMRIRSYITNSYENLVCMFAFSQEQKKSIQDISSRLQTLENQLITDFNSHITDYILQILPAQIDLAVYQFIEEDKQGNHGKKWRVSGK